MSKKIPVGIALAMVLVCVAATVAVTVSVYLNMYNDLIQDLPQRSEQYDKLNSVDELIRSKYYGEIRYDYLDANIAEGYVNGLGDPYSTYIKADEYDIFESIINGKLPGIGIEAEYDNVRDCLAVKSVNPDSPAFAEGIEEGNIILSVNGEKISRDNADKLYEDMTESLSGSVKFTFAADENSDESRAELKNGFNEKSCHYSVNGNIGYIRLSDIYEDTPSQFAEAVEEIKKASAVGIILDLRNCSSINLESASEIIDMIVPLATEGTGAIYTAKNSADETLSVYSSDSASISLKFAVLMNDRTECAAELIACDLRDFGKAVLFGESTAGHGTMQQIFRFEDGGAVLLSVAEIYPYISESFDGNGVEPDVEILTDNAFKNDIGKAELKDDGQYQKAFAYLSGK